MKLSIHPFLRPPALAAFSLALAATSVFAQTTLLSDSFDTVGVKAPDDLTLVVTLERPNAALAATCLALTLASARAPLR